MFKILNEKCIPHRASQYSAYVDLFSAEDVIIGAGETKVIKLGVKLDIESFFKQNFVNAYETEEGFLKSHYLEVALRSSLGVKGLIIANGIGVIDLDYPDEIGLIVTNSNNYDFFVTKGDKVAQCTLKEHKGYLLGYESEDVRTGGFGSSGDK